uniref:26S proteasome non-ATPase regulatory subunit 2 homolog n=1 Tax=Chrysotila carterae TaxID=13221 RepID=A0A7S4BU81_CHRCT
MAKKEEKKEKKDKKEEDELSEEDKALQEQMELLVTRCSDPEPELRKAALNSMISEIRTSTSSMTSVPKPLKFLRTHYAPLKEVHAAASDSETKTLLADVLSVLAMTKSEQGKHESLDYRLLGSQDDVGSWGHEYVRHLAAEIGEEYNERLAAAEKAEEAKAEGTAEADAAPLKKAEDLLPLILEHMVPFFISHNSEAEAIDLLMEVGQLDALVAHVDKTNCKRICLYLGQVANYVPEPEDAQVLSVAVAAFRKLGQYPEALKMAVRLQQEPLIEEILGACEDPLIKKQMAYFLARQGLRPEAEEELERIMDGAHLTEHYLELARDLDVLEPKAPEDVYKSHLERRGSSSSHVDSARQNLAATFVNAFLNVGFGTDKLMLDENSKWLYKNKEHGMMSAAASLGAILCWDVDGGLTQIDKYLYSTDNHIKAGALLSVGVLNCGVRNECDPALALLSEYVEQKHPNNIKMGALLGLGLAYAGTKKEEVLELLMPVVADLDTPLEVVAITSLALGLVFTGSCHDDISQALMTALMERPQESLQKESLTRFICVGVGLLYLGRQQEVELTLELAKAVPGAVGEYCVLTLETCAYAGTGNVLKVQKLMAMAGEHAPKEEEAEAEAAAPAPAPARAGAAPAAPPSKEAPSLEKQAVATFGIGLVAMGEELGCDMTARTYLHLFQYCDPPVRRAVPLGLALLSTSSPMKNTVIDTISKMTHDLDQEVAISAIISLGLVAGGTNNAKVASSLRSLATYYAKEPGLLFAVRLAQGLVHAGKGLVTLSPFNPDRTLLHPVALAALTSVMHLSLDFKGLVLGKYHFLLYLLVAAMRPRMLVTLDTDLKPLPVTVRVGQAVDVVGQAGQPKTITGFQTHTTPVLLSMGERAELATDEYLPLTSIMEGIVILKKNPEFDTSTK